MTSTTSVTLNQSHADILAADLAELMPGCDIHTMVSRFGGITATALHRVTGRTLSLEIGPGMFTLEGEWRLRTSAGASTLGTSAYSFDGAVVHAYRHDLDYTSEHGPGTAWALAELAEVAAR